MGNDLFSAYSPNWSKPYARGHCCWSQVPATQPTMRSFLRMWLQILLFFNVVMLNLISSWKTGNTSGFHVMGKFPPVSLPKLTMEMELQALIGAWISCRALGWQREQKACPHQLHWYMILGACKYHIKRITYEKLLTERVECEPLQPPCVMSELPCYICRVLLFTMYTYLSCSTHSFLF